MKRDILKLYAVTDRRSITGSTFEEAVRASLEGGVTILQLREKELHGSALLDEAKRIKSLCSEYGVPFIVNDDAELALAVKADGVHLGQGDGDAASARKLLGSKMLIGVSAHNVAEAVAAEAAGADYLGCGAVFTTSTKDNTGKLEYETLCQICRAINIPAVAIGGITPGNIAHLAGSGIAGAAVASALFGAADITGRAKELLLESERLFY